MTEQLNSTPQNWRIAKLLVVCLVAFLASSLRAAPAADFFQLLNQAKEFPADACAQGRAQGAVPCLESACQMGNRALKQALGEELLETVLAKPFEDGAKAAIGYAFPGSKIVDYGLKTYDLVKCAMDEEGPRRYWACVGIAMGKGVEGKLKSEAKSALALDDAVNSKAVDTLYNKIRKKLSDAAGVDELTKGRAMIRSYEHLRAVIEAKKKRGIETFSRKVSVSGVAGDRCEVDVVARWNHKLADVGQRGGVISLLISSLDCECSGAKEEVDRFYTRLFDMQVKYVPYAGTKPGWRLAPPPRIRMECLCCNGFGTPDTGLYFDSTGRLLRSHIDDKPEGSKTNGQGAQTPKPSPAPKPAAPRPQYSKANPCPACRPLKRSLDRTIGQINVAEAQRRTAQTAVQQHQQEQAKLADDVKKLEHRLKGETGVGGESYDPATGHVTESYDIGDGRVRIRVIDKRSGEVLSERYRDRESSEEIASKLQARKKDLKAAEKALQLARERLNAIERRLKVLKDRRNSLDSALEHCIAKRCVPPPKVKLDAVHNIDGHNPLSPSGVGELRPRRVGVTTGPTQNPTSAPTSDPTQVPTAEPTAVITGTPTAPPTTTATPTPIPTTTATPTPVPPMIAAMPTSAQFTHEIGTSSCPQFIETIRIENRGGGQLRWNAAVTRGAAWLSLSRSSGIGSGSIDLSFNCAQVGNLSGEVRIRGTEAQSSRPASNEAVIRITGVAE